MTQSRSSKIKADYFSEFESDAEDTPESSTQNSTEDFAALLGESLKAPTKKLKVGDKIRGKILVLGQDDVYVSTGTQHDGVVSRRELLDAEGNCPYQRDDVIELYVTQVKGGEVRLSKNPTDRNKAEDLQQALENRLPIPGRVVEVCKGGVRVNVKGKLAFCPISQLDSKHVESAEEYVGKSFDFMITQVTEGGRNIVVSRRKLLDEEREIGTATFLSEKKDGDVVPAKITRLEKFGAFAELAPGVEGLIHISEIAWSRIGDPSEVLQVGQEVQTKILRREVLNGRAKISLSIKQAMPKEEKAANTSPKDDPWAKLSVGQVITGKVNRKEPYGLFVQLEPGITGLLHKSQTFDQSEFHFEKVRVNDEIAVRIGEIRLKERQISLTLPKDDDAEDWRQHQAKQSASSSGSGFGNLGDQLKAALAKKK